jgi:SYP5 family syntaxin
MTATARRKTGTLGTQIDKLFQWLDSAESSGVSEQEKYRRRDNLHALKSRREQLLVALKRNQQGASNRESLMAGSSSVARVAAIETEATAALDNRGMLQLQQNVIQQQDQELEYMERTIGSTKHIALTIGEHDDSYMPTGMHASVHGHQCGRDVAAMLVDYTIAMQRHGYI